MKETLIFDHLGAYSDGVSQSTGQQWRKQEAVFTTIGDYPKTIAIAFFNDKVDCVTNLVPGYSYEVNFDIESREFNGKYYTNVNGWMVIDPSQQPQYQQPQQYQQQPQYQGRPQQGAQQRQQQPQQRTAQQQRPPQQRGQQQQQGYGAQRPPLRQQPPAMPQQQQLNYDDSQDDLPF